MKNKIDIENSGYLNNIKKVWDLKDAAYEETKDLNYSEYVDYIQNELKSMKEKFKDRLVRM